MGKKDCGNVEGKKDSFSGVITAFFSLALLLVIVLVTTMAEAARVAACGRLSAAFVEIGAKSLLGSYDLPLYENYHIFGRYCEGAGNGNTDDLREELEWYLNENMGGMTWLNMSPGNVGISDVCVLTESNGAPFYEQALQYAKYQDAALLAEWLLESAGVLQQSEDVGLVVQKKYEADKQAAQAEEKLVQLIGCVDGFLVEEGAFSVNRSGNPKTTASFAKKLIPGGAAQETVLPGNPGLYAIQKKNYIDPAAVLRDILRYRQLALPEQAALDLLWQEYARLLEEYEYAVKLDSSKQEELLRRMERKGEEISRKQGLIEDYILKCNNTLRSLWQRIRETKQQSETALLLLGQMRAEKAAAAGALESFEKELEGYQDKIPEEVLEELQQESQELLCSLNQENAMGILPDIDGMENALRHNVGIFEMLLQNMPLATQERGVSLAGWMEEIQSASVLIGQLKLEPLVFCYDEIRFPSAGGNGYKSLVKQLMEYGFAGLVLENPEKLSRGYINPLSCPSLRYTGETEKNVDLSLSDLLDWKGGELFSLESGSLGGLLQMAAEELLEQLLYLSYLSEHFANYSDFISEADKDAGEGSENTAVEGIKYQLEYIIRGKVSDFENLSSVIVRIFAIRFAMNMAAILCNAKARAQVKEAAVAIAGFTGIGALVLLMELLIEMLWAAECAAVETAALLKGGEVSFLTVGKELAVRFSELLRCSKNVMMGKAEELAREKKGGVLKSYKEYLYVFLLLGKKELRTMRSMDIIQQMIHLKYHSGFRLEDCVYGISVKAKAVIPYRFLPITGIGLGEGVSKTVFYGISY